MILLLWLLPFWLPLVAAGFALLPIRGRGWLLPIAAVPALVMGVVGSPGQLPDLSWLLLDIRVSLDPLGQLLLALTGLLWLAAGAAARPGPGADRGFAALWLVTLAGNVGLLQSGDAVTFYSCFAVMTFAAYGLVVHDRTAAAMRAGRVYMVLAVAGEVAIFSGLVLATSAAGTTELAALGPAVAVAPNRSLIVGLVLAGFGVKAGVIPLHIWLPLAHPAAPVPASAVLSGAMIKAGLIGWLRVLPIGEVALPGWATLVVTLGLLTAIGGVVIGLTQRNPKANLAYSSVSQMGLMTVLVGVALAVPDGGELSVAAAGVYALHHGLAKGALFLGVGVLRAESDPRRHRWLLAGMGVAALSLAGLPLSSGALAKIQSKAAVGVLPEEVGGPLLLGLSMAAAGTTVLMGRLLLMVRMPADEGRVSRSLLGPWLLVLAAVAVGTWALPAVVAIPSAPVELYGAVLWEGLWPVLLGAGLVTAAWQLHRRTGVVVGEVPAGDLVVLVETTGRRVTQMWRGRVAPSAVAIGALLGRFGDLILLAMRPGGGVARVERFLSRWRTAGAIFVVLGLVLLILLVSAAGSR